MQSFNELNRLSKEYLNKDDLERKIEFCNDLQSQKDAILTNIAAYEKRVAELSKGIRELQYFSWLIHRAIKGDWVA